MKPRSPYSFSPNFLTNRISAGSPLLGGGPDRMNPMGKSEGADPRRDNGVGLTAEGGIIVLSNAHYCFKSFCCISHVRGDLPW